MQEEETPRQKKLAHAFYKMAYALTGTKEKLVDMLEDTDGKAGPLIESTMARLSETLLREFADMCSEHSLESKLHALDRCPETIKLAGLKTTPEEIVAEAGVEEQTALGRLRKESIAKTEEQNRELWKEIQDGRERNEKIKEKIQKMREAIDGFFQNRINTNDFAKLKQRMDSLY
ncbi:MAG: uncharacterized protein A8A55_0035 [Amphiamblys sp. WSBS2006]|nr:MAG: uncharacterized protein A8A55_0035 [Amphiamblys sp. WSBS2006]